ncbi:MAG: hypothetical protein ACQEUG_11030 [Pseudomonadota bacterium]
MTISFQKKMKWRGDHFVYLTIKRSDRFAENESNDPYTLVKMAAAPLPLVLLDALPGLGAGALGRWDRKTTIPHHSG